MANVASSNEVENASRLAGDLQNDATESSVMHMPRKELSN